MKYKDELTTAMTMLGAHPKSVFVGQSVQFGGQAMFPTLDGVPREKRVEFPVAEELQMGYCTGLAMAGFLPVSIYPRIDFLILAANQLVNHLDKTFRQKVIIRCGVGGKKPFDAGPQHSQDHSAALEKMLTHIDVVRLDSADMILKAYSSAISSTRSTILVEYMEKYYE